ncbi:MAG TPA: carotenoid biosynthesis protein [Bryobacteraceae bacterium]|nr:carotenoid biosynthesis protein [Bryobacteraceae bacterium]
MERTFTHAAVGRPPTELAGRALGALTAIYAAARLLHLVQDRIPLIVLIALWILVPLAFALIHGTLCYGLRGMLIFVALCLAIGNIVENVGIRTGMPFGRYFFTDVMGPKILQVPILLGLAYVGMGYLSWFLGCQIVGPRRSLLAAPLLAALIMISWDVALDPVWSTIHRGWIWLDGGAYFGVPLINFAGWYCTVGLIYLSFAVISRRWPAEAAPLPPAWRKMPVALYAVAAGGNLLLWFPLSGWSSVADPAGRQWHVGSIFAACALVSIVVMGGFALLAWAKIGDRTPNPSRAQAEA